MKANREGEANVGVLGSEPRMSPSPLYVLFYFIFLLFIVDIIIIILNQNIPK